MANISKAERERAIEEIKKLAPKGTCFYAIVRGISSSGSYTIGLVLIQPGKDDPNELEVRWPTYLVSTITGRQRKTTHTGEGIVVTGTGLNHAEDLVETLASIVWDDAKAYTYRAL